MADITNTMNASIPINTVSGQMVSPESPESALLSPGVREAMDLIFPKPTTQLLQRGHSLEEDKFLGVKASKENLYPGTTATPTSHLNAIAPVCCISSAYTTTTTTTTTCIGVAASSEVTSAYGNGSHALSLSPYMFTYTPPVYSPAVKNQDEAKEPCLESKTTELPRRSMPKISFSKSVLDVSTDDEFVEKESTRGNSVCVSSEFSFRGNSDSEDMMRPFESNVKEKKKQKKKKRPKPASLICENNEESDIQVPELSKSCINNDTYTLDPCDSSVATQRDIISNRNVPKHNYSQEYLGYNNFSNINTSHLNSGDSVSQMSFLTNGPLTKNLHMFSENLSNITFPYSTESAQNGKEKSRQGLPELKRHYFNIVKHKNKIRNSFPPCFVVTSKVDFSPYKPINHLCVADSALPLLVRLKHLSNLCDKGSVDCKKKKVVYEMVYKNIFEETVLPQVVEEDVDSLRGKRSLRKRDKHISYVEPSEDDILDEYSRKRPRTKHKDVTGKSEDESFSESKKRRKKSSSDSKTISTDIVAPVIINPPQEISVEAKVVQDTIQVAESKKTEVTDQPKVTAAGKTKSTPKSNTPKEIIVYPPTSSSVKNSYFFKVDGKDVTSGAAGKSHQKTYSKKKNKDKNSELVQPSNNISVLQPNTLPGSFMRHPNAVMLFPSLQHGFPGNVTAKPLASGVPACAPASSTPGEPPKPPQYCVVKMDGANVLLQIVPSSGIGAPTPVLMPKGKAMLASPVPLAPKPQKQPQVPGSNSTQALQNSLLSGGTASQVNITPQVNVSSASLQPLFGIPVISTSSQNVPLPVSPIISPLSASQLTSVASTSITSSGVYLSQNSTAGRYVTVMSSLNPRITSTVASITSSSLSSQTLPAIVTSMAAPNTTTVVRSVRMPGPTVRALAPNQPTSLRSVRIYVPGCYALGTPGHFATIGSIANSSPLTHLTASSALLPQRKTSSDPELTPEQRSARRRKLEKKYPLPPGVVIKTEPLDVGTQPSCATAAANAARSLLSQNLHLLSTSRPGTSFQSIRIISPSLASALSGKNIRGNSGIIYRAASIGGRQTVLLPASFRQISPKTTAAVTSTSLTTSSSFASSSPASLESSTVTTGVDTATTTAVVNTTCTGDTSVMQTVSLSSSKTPSDEILPPSICSQLVLSENTLTSMPTTTSANTVELLTEGIPISQTSVITSCESSVTTNATSLTTPCESYSSATAVLSNSVVDQEMYSDKSSSDAVSLESIRASLEEFRKMIQIQEARGLKGERLDKLKELLHRKEEHYTGLQNLTSVSTSFFGASEITGDTTDAVNCADSSQDTVSADEHHGSETDPLVID